MSGQTPVSRGGQPRRNASARPSVPWLGRVFIPSRRKGGRGHGGRRGPRSQRSREARPAGSLAGDCRALICGRGTRSAAVGEGRVDTGAREPGRGPRAVGGPRASRGPCPACPGTLCVHTCVCARVWRAHVCRVRACPRVCGRACVCLPVHTCMSVCVCVHTCVYIRVPVPTGTRPLGWSRWGQGSALPSLSAVPSTGQERPVERRWPPGPPGPRCESTLPLSSACVWSGDPPEALSAFTWVGPSLPASPGPPGSLPPAPRQAQGQQVCVWVER